MSVAVSWRYTDGMDTRPPQGPGRLPPPPAPTARDANPWQFSATARQAESGEPRGFERLIAELEQVRVEREGDGAGAPADVFAPGHEQEPETATEPQGRPASTFNRVFPIVILLIMFGSFARETLESRGGDEAWVPLVVAFFVLAVFVTVVLARRKSRRRRALRET